MKTKKKTIDDIITEFLGHKDNCFLIEISIEDACRIQNTILAAYKLGLRHGKTKRLQ